MNNKIVYNNLGSNSGDRNMYIRSTDIERKNWESLLISFSDEALYFMCKGKKIVIIDRCNKLKGKIQRIFCPAFSDFLRLIRGEMLKNKVVKHHTYLAYNAYLSNKRLYRKYKFFKDKLKCLYVVGRTIKVKKERSVWDGM